MNSVVTSQAQATKVAADFHGFDSQQNGQSPLQTAYARLISLRSLLGHNRPDEQLTWGLMAGSLQLVIRYADQQASCFLQNAWQDNVIAPSRWTLNQADRADKLYGENGVIWTFCPVQLSRLSSVTIRAGRWWIPGTISPLYRRLPAVYQSGPDSPG